MTSPDSPTPLAPPRLPPHPPTRPPGRRADALGIAACVAGALAIAVTAMPSTTLLCGPLGLAGLVLAIIALARRRGATLLPVLAAAFGSIGLVIGTALVASAILLGGVGPTSGQSDGASARVPASLVFGQTHRYDDGVAVTVAEPEAFTPIAEAERVEGGEAIAVTFTIENGSAVAMDPTALPSASSAGRTSESLFEPGLCESGATTVILPGASFSWTECYSVADRDDVVVEISPSFDRQTLVFSTDPAG